MGVKEFLNQNDGEEAAQRPLVTATRDQLTEEIHRRDSSPNHFPLDVFHEKLNGWIEALVKEYEFPDCHIGLNLLAAYSTAIGTAYTVSANGTDKVYLPLWGAMVGLSSGGKSWVMDKIMRPFDDIQDEFNDQWDTKTERMADDKKVHHRQKTVVYRDSFVATLTRYVLPDNPKGVLKSSDELLEWVNGMDGMNRGKDGVDQQFWVSSWNCKSYRIIRSMKNVYNLRRPFINVLGGITYEEVNQIFTARRGTNGFVYRLLFAKPMIKRLPMFNPDFNMPAEWTKLYSDHIKTMYHSLPVEDDKDAPRQCILSKEARQYWYKWGVDHVNKINKMQDPDEMEMHSGFFGKIREYALRFAALLAISDIALNLGYYNGPDRHSRDFKDQVEIGIDVIKRAIKLADYFYVAGVSICMMVRETQFAPLEVLQTAILLKSGRSYQEMAAVVWGKKADNPAGKKRMERSLKKWTKMYPKVFNSYSTK